MKYYQNPWYVAGFICVGLFVAGYIFAIVMKFMSDAAGQTLLPQLMLPTIILFGATGIGATTCLIIGSRR